MRFSDQILKWYKIHRRDMPWRHTRDAYKIWLSEVILQQTRVDQGTAYYNRFVKRFPGIQDLADASEQEVLKLWQGLGYYSRARNLHFASRQIMKEFDGVFPSTYDEIIKLKGVGDYTAAAIASIAFDESHAVVDGNVKRVISRIYGIELSGNKLHESVKKIITGELDKENPGDFNQAVMEFGALQCVPKNPRCGDCIFNKECIAYLLGKVEDLPAREIKKKPRKRYFSYFVIHPSADVVILKKRNDKDIWKNLYEFPLIETTSEANAENLLREPDFISWFGNKAGIAESSKTYKHQLSHQTIFARFYSLNIENEDIVLHPDWEKIVLEDIDEYPVSRLIERFLED